MYIIELKANEVALRASGHYVVKISNAELYAIISELKSLGALDGSSISYMVHCQGWNYYEHDTRHACTLLIPYALTSFYQSGDDKEDDEEVNELSNYPKE